MLSEIMWDEATLAIAGAFLVPIVGIVSAAWYKITRATSENDLKRRMIERGFSAEEIERVLAARSRR